MKKGLTKKGKDLPNAAPKELPVQVGYEIRQVKDIDCVAQRYFCDFTVFLKWHSDAHVRLANDSVSVPVKVEEVDVPAHYIANEVELEKRDEELHLDPKDPPGTVTYEAMYTGVLAEFMELEYFPLDLQDLSIMIRFKETYVTCTTLMEKEKYQRIRDSVEMAEWNMFEPELDVSVGKQGRTTWTLKMRIYRLYGYYVWNVMLPIGAFTGLSFFAFLYEADDWYERSTYDLQLLLAFVAFKFVIAGTLPKVSFFTILDLYLFFSFLFLILLMAEFVLMKALYLMEVVEGEVGANLDRLICLVLFVFWLIVQTVFTWRFRAVDKTQRGQLGCMVNAKEEKKSVLTSFLFGAGEDPKEEVMPLSGPGQMGYRQMSASGASSPVRTNGKPV